MFGALSFFGGFGGAVIGSPPSHAQEDVGGEPPPVGAPNAPTVDAVVFAPTGDSLRVFGGTYVGSGGDAHDSTAIQVDTAGGDFSSPQYWDVVLGAVETDTVAPLDSAAVVDVRMQYHGETGGWSDWGSLTDVTMSSTALHPNEPVGYTEVFNTAWNTQVPAGWSGFSVNNLSIETDATAPFSPSNIAACLFPEGFVGGGGPINTSAQIEKTEFYTHFQLKLSSNWFGHPVGVKLFFIRNTIAGQNKGDIIFFIAGAGSNPLSFEIRTQNTVGGGVNYVGGVGGLADATLTRDVWADIEVILVSDSEPGAFDGEIHVWIDGVKTHERTDASLLRTGADRQQDIFQWNPTYGGGDVASVPADMFQYIDHIYVSAN
jgi:hypothetical protein